MGSDSSLFSMLIHISATVVLGAMGGGLGDVFIHISAMILGKCGGDLVTVEYRYRCWHEHRIHHCCKRNWKLDLAKLAGGPKINIL